MVMSNAGSTHPDSLVTRICHRSRCRPFLAVKQVQDDHIRDGLAVLERHTDRCFPHEDGTPVVKRMPAVEVGQKPFQGRKPVPPLDALFGERLHLQPALTVLHQQVPPEFVFVDQFRLVGLQKPLVQVLQRLSNHADSLPFVTSKMCCCRGSSAAPGMCWLTINWTSPVSSLTPMKPFIPMDAFAGLAVRTS